MTRNGYRPTDTDFTDTNKFQQLSCREAGKFDYERRRKLLHDAAKEAAVAAVQASKKEEREDIDG